MRDIPLAHLLANTQVDLGKLPACSLPLLDALLSGYKVRLAASHGHIVCPTFHTMGPGVRGCSISIDCADGVPSPADGIAHEPSELKAVSQIRLEPVQSLVVKNRIGLGVAKMMLGGRRQQLLLLDSLTMCGTETEMRQLVIDAGRGAINEVSLGFVCEGRHEFIKAEDEREGITPGDYRHQLPRIKSLVMYLDVPSADVVNPGVFILSSIWSVLEIESISQLTVVLREHFHLDALKNALQRRFGSQQIRITVMHGQLRFVLAADRIGALRKAAFAHSSVDDMLNTEGAHKKLTVRQLSLMFERYFPSLPPNVSAEALTSDFAGRMRAAAPMTVVDPPYAPRRLKAPLMAAMERHGVAMEPMLRLHGDGPCLPSPSVIASPAQLMAILQTTGKQTTGIELLYKATVHGFAYTNMLDRVGDASCLLFLVRANGDMDGCLITSSLQPPRNPERGRRHTFKSYDADALVFTATGPSPLTFQFPFLKAQCVTLSRGYNELHSTCAKLMVGRSHTLNTIAREWLGLWAPDTLSCSASEGCVVRVRWETVSLTAWDQHKLRAFLADEIEVFQLLQ
ncbi:unnamed protein product [Vitrella brassicaformis CCMP3155]|uniref:TLDc domain-containing protein n=1 Tax=Vitrella brassicaformis (strain CCMP3155) TaxID=1169540 RepID=A0A0G4G255_VITBC|nr:unnamed protein product [Vitrella brassicaformis CCMP3155]|eukprot:CEM21831.1 unnamed protein product [Vitrella brassicaformis CCMP3155]